MTGQTDEEGGQSRPVFKTEQEKPVAIFLPQHRPGKAVSPSKPVMAAVTSAVVILGASLFFMMPRGEVGRVAVATADAGPAAPVRSIALDGDRQDEAVGAIVPDQPAGDAGGAPQTSEPAATKVAAAAPAARPPRAANVPRKDDPRWARAETRSGSAALEAVRKLIVEKAAAPVDDAGSNLLAYAGASHSTSAFDDVMTRRPMQIVLPAELPEQPDASARTASVNAPVNMRKGPGAKHGVMLVIPRRARIDVFDCDQWCKVGYDGQTGYIYKSFVSGRPS